jgi:hypothetical protein
MKTWKGPGSKGKLRRKPYTGLEQGSIGHPNFGFRNYILLQPAFLAPGIT